MFFFSDFIEIKMFSYWFFTYCCDNWFSIAFSVLVLGLLAKAFHELPGLEKDRRDYPVNGRNRGEKEIGGVFDLEEALRTLIRLLKRLINLYRALAKLLGIPLDDNREPDNGNSFKKKRRGELDSDLPEEQRELEKLIKEIEALEIKIKELTLIIAVPTTFSWTWAAIDYWFNVQDLRAIARIIGEEAACIFAALMVGGLFVASGVSWLLFLDPAKKRLLELKKQKEILEKIVKAKRAVKEKYTREMVRKGEIATYGETAVLDAGRGPITSNSGPSCTQRLNADGVTRRIGK